MKSKKEHSTTVSSHPIVKSVVHRPWISEKSQRALEKNQYVFLVDRRANKNMIKEEIGRRYNVHVVNVNITRLPGKTKRYGRRVTQKQDMKKAIVSLKKDEKIEIV